jgi:Flp pilus assembly protein TadG
MTFCFTLLRDRAGVASIEAALVTVLVLVPMLGGATDAGMILYTWGKVTRSEQAGLMSAWGGAASAATMQAAAQTAYGTAAVVPTIQASIACYCLPTATTYSRGSAAAVGCTTTCGSGQTLTQFATVSVSTTVTLPMPVPPIGLTSPFSVGASATGRLQ